MTQNTQDRVERIVDEFQNQWKYWSEDEPEWARYGKQPMTEWLTNALTKALEEVREERDKEIVEWINSAEWDEESAANDPTNDFIAHDAYETKAQAWFYGYNQALLDLKKEL